MAKLILSMDGLVLKEIPLTKERTTIGRKPHNDIQIDNLAVSGEHALIVTILNDSFLEDLGSTNGTLVNGAPIKKHFLQPNDVIELGKYKLKYINELLTPGLVYVADTAPYAKALAHVTAPILGGYDSSVGPSLTRPFNMTGYPALSICNGFSGTGMPISLQIAGRPFEDHIVLKAGDALLMRPLLLHASTRINGGGNRRVLHFLFGPPNLPFGLQWHTTV